MCIAIGDLEWIIYSIEHLNFIASCEFKYNISSSDSAKDADIYQEFYIRRVLDHLILLPSFLFFISKE